MMPDRDPDNLKISEADARRHAENRDLIWWCAENDRGWRDVPDGECGNGLAWMADGKGHLLCGFRRLLDPTKPHLEAVNDA